MIVHRSFRTLVSVACVIGLLAALSTAVAAQQQQYANAYAFWEFGDKVNDVESIDQTIWIAKPATGSQWVLIWTWTADPAHGGYLGFNTSDEGKSQALFSLWNADQAKGKSCAKFGGEGEGWSCRMPFEINADTQYQLRLVRTGSDKQGVWWSAWIIEDPSGDAPVEHLLGEIRVNAKMNSIRGNSIANFSEYFGGTVPKCSQVPVSILALAPPAANRNKATGDYAHTGAYRSGTDPKDNPCKTGNEASGNMLKVEPFDFGLGDGAIIFIGGTSKDHVKPDLGDQ